MEQNQQQTCQGCCGYPYIVVPQTRQAFVKSLETSPTNKYSTFNSPDKLSRIDTLKSTSAGRDTSPSRMSPSIVQIRPLVFHKRRELSPNLEALEVHIEKKRSECNFLRQQYRRKEQHHQGRLAKLQKDFYALVADYKNKMRVLDFIEDNILQIEKRSQTKYPQRCFSTVGRTRA